MKKVFTCSFCLIITFISSLSAQFGEEIRLSESNYFTNMQVGDIDGDGRKDIVSNEMHWYRQKENKQFEVGKYLGLVAERVNLHDLDENGTLDIIYNLVDKDSIFWLPNTGNGIFEPARFVGRLFDAILTFEDIDKDGDLDILGRTATINSTSRTIRWFQNDGSENFTTRSNLTSSSVNNLINDVVLEDFDEDGDLDVYFSRSSKVYWSEHLDGQGTFASPQIWINVSNSTSHKVKKIEFLDIDHDGKRDLLMFADNTSKPIRWYRKTIDNNIESDYRGIYGTSFVEGSFHSAELNNDTLTDILLHDDNEVLWLPGKADDIHTIPFVFLGRTSTNSISNIIIDDIDNDGNSDFIYRQGDKVYRISNMARQADPAGAETAVNSSHFLRQMDMGDINGDGLLDIITQGDRISWQAKLPGKSVFSEPRLVPFYNSDETDIFKDSFIKLIDWDGDGDLDILSGHFNKACWYPNQDGLGNFGYGQVLVDNIENLSTPFIGIHEGTILEDFDLNGHLDFVGLSTSESGVFYWRNDGNDQFSQEKLGTFTNNVKLASADVGADGDQDIILINDPSSGSNMIVWIENINGVFQAPDTLYSYFGLGFTYPFSSDLNQDGQTYILYQANPNFDEIKALKFNNGVFENIGAIFSHPDDFEFIDAKDIDGDDDEDLVISFSDKQTIHWVENVNGSFNTAHQLLDSVALPRVFFHEDISGDGLKDIVYLQGWDDHPLSTSFNNINAVVQYEQVNNAYQNSNRTFINTQHGIRFGSFVDLDGDGDLDYFGKQQDHFLWKENYDGAGHFSSERKLGDILYPEDATSNLKVLFFDHGNDGDLDFVENKKLYELENLQVVDEQLIDDINNQLEYFKAADLNGDDFEDLYAYGYREDYIAYFEYLPGSGTYAPLDKIVENYPNLIYGANTIDFDNDGDQDLFIGGGTPPLTLNSGFSPLYYTLNDGLGNFPTPDSLLGNVSNRPSIVTGDVNQDGTEDVVLAHQYGNTFHYTYILNWYSNVPGTDSLSAPVLIGSFDENSSSVEDAITNVFLSDLDGDGDLDVATSTVWFENQNGKGDFSEAKIYNDFDRDGLRAATQLQDINGDGAPDLLQTDGYKISQTENNQLVDNTKQLIEVRNSVDVVLHYFDVDLDGDKDMLASNASTVYWYRNDPDGDFNIQFIEAGLLVQTPNNGTIKSIHSADMNSDGQLDLVLHYEKYIGWYEAKGDGTMSNLFRADYSSNDGVLQIFLTDVDSDGDMDIVKTYDGTTRRINWIENMDGHGLFDVFEHSIYTPQNPGPYVTFSSLADVDDDGDMDVLFNEEHFGGSNTELYWLENTGGTFSAPTLLMTINGRGLHAIKHLDLDLDNDKDFLIVTSFSNGTVDKFLYYRNNGGSYEPLTWLEVSFLNSYKLMDVNNDYLPDLVLNYEGDEGLYWSPQDSIATFGPVEKILLAKPVDFNEVEAMDVHDFDGDFDLDIFYHTFNRSEGTNTLNWRKNLIAQPVIRGRCFFDENQNASLDTLERGLHNFSTILNPMSLLSFSDTLGIFKYFVDPGTYDLTYQAPPLWALSTDSASYHIIVDTAEQEYNYHFGFYPLVDSLSIEPFLVSAPTRCNFEVPFWLNYHNTGTRIASGVLRLVKPIEVAYISASITPDSIKGDTLLWHFSDLYPFNKEEIDLVFRMPNKFSAGEIIHFETIVEVLDTLVDSTYVNQHLYSSEIRCAIDPNDKLVNPNRLEDYPENYTLFGEDLEYTIRFQNTGNDTAFNIVVTDQLDSKLDWNSVEIIGASHAYTVSLDNAGLLTFEFRNILLPDSTTNEMLSHGYVSYIVSPQEGLGEMTIIENTASIFFDFNAPIITNTTENNLVSSLDFSDSLKLSINGVIEILCAGDSTGRIAFDVTGVNGNYEVFLNGNFVAQLPSDSMTQSIDSLAAGVYTLKITDSFGHAEVMSFTILEPAPLAVELISNIPETCTDLGSISLQGIGGTGPYQYLWSDSTTAPQISGIAGNYSLTITDSNGCIDTSSYEILDDCLDATDELEQYGIKIYPNPLHANEYLIIETPFVDYELNVFNALGQKILKEKVGSKRHTVGLHSFAEGVYWLVLSIGKEEYSKRIIKID